MDRLTLEENIGLSIDKGNDCPSCYVCWACDKKVRKCPYFKDAIKKLKHYEDMEEQGKLVILPCKPGDTVYVITRCNYISEVLDGDMYEPDGSPGDATGYYCPYELSQKCPHDCEEFTRCEDYKYKRAVFEDAVAQIHITEDDLFVVCENTGIYRKIGKDIFLTEHEAQEALEKMKGE